MKAAGAARVASDTRISGRQASCLNYQKKRAQRRKHAGEARGWLLIGFAETSHDGPGSTEVVRR
jgi:hypothetical protein